MYDFKNKASYRNKSKASRQVGTQRICMGDQTKGDAAFGAVFA
jgi:hypothetical protein